MMERDLVSFLRSHVSDTDVETINFRALNRKRL